MNGFELFQIWLIAFFTLALFSFLYKDNPIYRIAEHIFAGLTAGYQVGLIWDTVIIQQLWDPMLSGRWWLLVPGILGFLMFTRFTQKYSWVSRLSLAFVMGVTAGIFIISELHGRVLPQMQDTMLPSSEAVDDRTVDVEYDIKSFLITSAESLAQANLNETTGMIEVVDTAAYADSITLANTEPEIQINKDNADSIVFVASFVKDSDLGFLDYYTPVCTLFNVGANKKISLGQMDIHRDNGFTMTENEDGTISVTKTFRPDENYETGTYNVIMAVEYNSIMLLLSLIIIIGVISTLIYFYFSHEHKGALGVTAKVGIWFIMISFGAHFGYTVMGRVSLLIGRVQFLVEDWVGSFSQLL